MSDEARSEAPERADAPSLQLDAQPGAEPAVALDTGMSSVAGKPEDIAATTAAPQPYNGGRPPVSVDSSPAPGDDVHMETVAAVEPEKSAATSPFTAARATTKPDMRSAHAYSVIAAAQAGPQLQAGGQYLTVKPKLAVHERFESGTGMALAHARRHSKGPSGGDQPALDDNDPVKAARSQHDDDDAPGTVQLVCCQRLPQSV